MRSRDQFLNDLNRLIGIYDCLLHETGGRCASEVYGEKILSIGKDYKKLFGNIDPLIDEVDLRISEYSSMKNWKYVDKMLSFLAYVKRTINTL